MTYVWIGIMLVAIVLELATPSALITIWFAFGALCAVPFAYFGASQMVQILVFAMVSVLSLLIIRPLAAKYLKTNIIPTNADRFIGEIGVVTKAISETQWGEVYIKSTYWSAVEVHGGSIAQDKKVKVVSIEGAKLLVKEIE